MNKNKKNKKSGLFTVAGVVAMMLVIFICMIVLMCRGTTGLTDWCYYDLFVESSNSVATSSAGMNNQNTDEVASPEVALDVDKRIKKCFNNAKETARNGFKEFTNLNWERFEKARVAEGLVYYYGPYDAMYIEKGNIVYAFQALKRLDDYEMEKVLAHELIHTLTLKDSETNILYEGFTEYLSVLLYESQQVSYLFPEKFAQLYAERYGLERAIDVFPTANVTEEISKSIPDRQNVMENIDVLLKYSSVGYDPNTTMVLLDVICHYCADIDGNRKIVEDLIEHKAKSFDYMTRQYFYKTLKGGDH